MKNLSFLLERKKAAFCILIGICSISFFIIINSGEKINEDKGDAYAIKIRHYGVDALEMERSITIPLEDALSAISGVISVQSSSENSLSNVYIRFNSGKRGRYEAVRDVVQRIYETLPSSVQRPEILSSDNSRIPVWSASFYTGNFDVKDNILIAQILEKTVKPKLESLEGAGEVIVSGVGVKEIIVVLDQEKSSSLGLDPSTIAAVLGMNDFIFPAGTVVQQDKEILVTVDGRYNENSSLENALVPIENGKFISLADIALITERERNPDILSRLNGKKTAGITIMGRNGANLRKLSLEINNELTNLYLPFEYTVLSDLGAEEAAAFRSVINAALSGAFMVALIGFLLNKKNTVTFPSFFCAFTIPIICLISVAILSIGGFSLDRLMFAGIAAGTGTAVDAVILVSEKLRKCADYKTASAALSELACPLAAGAATTVAALIPLFSIEENSIKIIAFSIAAVTLTALTVSLSVLPPLLLWKTNLTKTNFLQNLPHFIKHIQHKLLKYLCRLLAANVKFCVRYPLLITGICTILSISAIIALIVKGTDSSSYSSENSLYAQVEFEGGLLAEEVDLLLASYSEQLARYNGIKNVETGARTGSGSLLITFDPRQTQSQFVRDLAKQIPIPGGFLFFYENSSNDRYWEIKIYGEKDQKCRELAEELAFILSDHKLVRERVLNFKDGSKKLILLPDRELFAETGISFSNAALRIRSGVYGPVVYKRMDSEGETDVRILTGGIDFINNTIVNNMTRQSRDGTLGILVSSEKENFYGDLTVESLVETKEETEPSGIRRDNRRRTASITITTKPMDARRVRKEISSLFNKIDLPPGYSIEFDPEAIKKSEALSATVLSFVTAVLFCYMIIAAINESFTFPLIALAAIPVSLSVPALLLVVSGIAYNSAVACAFIAASGMTVNAAILCADGLRLKNQTYQKTYTFRIFLALRKEMPVLLATNCTTVAGVIPFIFLTEGANSLIRTFSLVSAIGVLCSFICSITLIPSLFIISKKFFI